MSVSLCVFCVCTHIISYVQMLHIDITLLRSPSSTSEMVLLDLDQSGLSFFFKFCHSTKLMARAVENVGCLCSQSLSRLQYQPPPLYCLDTPFGKSEPFLSQQEGKRILRTKPKTKRVYTEHLAFPLSRQQRHVWTSDAPGSM